MVSWTAPVIAASIVVLSGCLIAPQVTTPVETAPKIRIQVVNDGDLPAQGTLRLWDPASDWRIGMAGDFALSGGSATDPVLLPFEGPGTYVWAVQWDGVDVGHPGGIPVTITTSSPHVTLGVDDDIVTLSIA